MVINKSEKIRVLGVDDEDKNLKLIEALLIPHQYDVLLAQNGSQALKVVQEEKVDVILLDIMMPGLNGFDVCQRLKENESTAHIPIILVTSLHEREQRLKGIAAGANDYVTKPIDKEDLILRVRNATRLKVLHDQTRNDYEKLKELEEMRDNLTNMIVHDLRSPLSGLIGHLELLNMSLMKDPVTEKQGRYLTLATQNGKTINDMIDMLLDVHKMEERRMKLKKIKTDMALIIRESADLVAASAMNSVLVIEEPKSDVTCVCDSTLMKRVVNNLLSNSLKFAPMGGRIRVSVTEQNNKIRVEVEDTGPGIPSEYHEKIFEKFGQVEMRNRHTKRSTGLGLTFCKLAVEAHGGQIGVESEEGEGSIFWFEIPIKGND